MKITCISDTHGMHREVTTNGGDLLIFAGDWQMNHRSRPKDFVLWLSEQDYENIVVVRGNHDNQYEELDYECSKYDTFIHVLHDNSVKIEGNFTDIGHDEKDIVVYGTAWTNQFGSWSYMTSEENLKKIYEDIDCETTILVSHGPAHEILDSNINGKKCGSDSLWHKIHNLDYLRLHVFGHIHEGYGMMMCNRYLAINASLTNEEYQLVNKPIDIEI